MNREMILCYGHDDVLLFTRQRVLETFGMPVITVTDAGHFLGELIRSQPVLVLFCQSLSSDECVGAAGLAKKHCPNSKIVVMYSQPGRCQFDDSHAAVFSLDGPVALLTTVKRVLALGDRSEGFAASAANAPVRTGKSLH